MSKRRLLAKIALGTAGLTLLAGLLHIPIARSLGSGCPFEAGTELTPAEREAKRRAVAEMLRGQAPAGSTLAMEFELGGTTRSELRAWSEGRGGTCVPGQDKRGENCANIQSESRGLGTLHADFDEEDRLVALSWQSRSEDAEAAAHSMRKARGDLELQIGDPTLVQGKVSANYLAQRSFQQARIEYRRSDYYASVSATNMGHSYLVSETYRNLQE